MTSRGVVLIVTLALVAGIVTAGCGELLLERSEGEKLWRKLCAECHGVDGAGKNPKYSRYAGNNLLDDHWIEGGEPYVIESVIREGIFPTMPAFDHLSESEIQAIIEHIRELRGGT